MRILAFFGILIWLANPAAADAPFSHFKDAARSAMSAYRAGDMKTAGKHTLRALELMADDPGYDLRYQIGFIDQYILFAGDDVDDLQKATRDIWPFFERVAIDTKFSDSRIVDMERELYGYLRGRHGRTETQRAHKMRQELFRKVTDDPWIGITLDYNEIMDMRNKRTFTTTRGKLKRLLEQAVAIDPNGSIVPDIELSLAKLDLEAKRPKSGRKKL
ncbi:MAG: hypothetical protein AAF337_14690, partial [Pseudomonadota bacterium]